MPGQPGSLQLRARLRRKNANRERCEKKSNFFLRLRDPFTMEQQEVQEPNDEDTGHGVQAGGRGSESTLSTLSGALNLISTILLEIQENLEAFRGMMTRRNLNFCRLAFFLFVVFVFAALAAIVKYIFVRG
jgi:hypothetical protein